ncbi:MAG: acyl-CoA oxidase domain protein [Solirubrobacterales bacterium]|nr:acyl-CoA oxidase domain protein [Solirubrobacterales bacterium]
MIASMSTTAAGASLDTDALRRWLDGEHRQIREQVRDRLAGMDLAQADGISRVEYRELVLRWATKLGREGQTALGFPRKYGGEGNVAGSIASFETLAHGDLSLLVKCGVQFGLFGGAILQLGTERHHEAYLRGVIDVSLPGCFAMSESAHGSDVQNVHTTATYDAATQEFVVHTPHDGAHKEWIGNAADHGRLAVVFAQLITTDSQTSHGVHALVVPIRDEDGAPARGVRIVDCGDKMGLQGVDNGRLWFDEVRVPREALLDRFASVGEDGTYSSSIENPDRRFFTMLGTLVQGRVSVGGAAISLSKNALTIAVRHALRRRQFTAPSGDEILLLDYRTHQRRLLPLLARTYALHAAQEQLVVALDNAFGDDDVGELARRELESHAAGLKALSTWHATATLQACREACGGLGYLAENRFASLKADSDIFTTFEGDNTVLLQLVGKSLLTGYKDQFGDLDPLGMVGFVAGQVFQDVVEKTAVRQVVQTLADVVPSRDDDSELLDREEQLLLLRYRAERVLASVARRLKRGIDDGHDAFEVFRACQDHVLAAAKAYIESVIGEAFAARVGTCEHADLKLALDRLCDLHLLHTIESDRAWYLEHGRLSPSRSKTLTRTVNRLLNEVRADACELVDGFAIPDAVLRAPIGVKDQGDRVAGL